MLYRKYLLKFEYIRDFIDAFPSVRVMLGKALFYGVIANIIDFIGLLLLSFLLSQLFTHKKTILGEEINIDYDGNSLALGIFIIISIRLIVVVVINKAALFNMHAIKAEISSRLALGYMRQKLRDDSAALFDVHRINYSDNIITLFTGFLNPILMITSEIIILLMIGAAFIIIEWKIVLPILGFFLFLIIQASIRFKKLGVIGAQRVAYETMRLSRLEKMSVGLIDIVMHGVIKKEFKNYNSIVNGLIEPDVKLAVTQFRSRPELESFIYVILLMVAINADFFNIKLESLIFIMVGLLRMLPSIGKISNSLNSLSFGKKAVTEITDFNGYLKEKESIRCNHHDGLSLFDTIKCVIHRSNNSETVADFIFKRGLIIRVNGASGAGKSALLKSILNIKTINIYSVFMVNIRANENIEIQNYYKKIGYVSQSSFIDSGSVKENVLFGRTESDEFLKIMVGVGLSNIDQNASELSGGQKQRLVLARELLKQPELLILDEAFSALDPLSQLNLAAFIRSYLPDACIIYVSHSETQYFNSNYQIYL